MRRILQSLTLLGALAVITVFSATRSPAGDPAADAAARWEADIARFEAHDRQKPPAKGGLVFAGSSSIRLWDLAASFPNLPALNRGFGGSEYADLVHFADRIILAYEPKIVVLYSGDNDIAAGKTPEQVAGSHEQLVRRVREKLPETRIVTIGIKPSIKRWKLIDEMREANRLIKKNVEQDERQVYIDVHPGMIGSDDQPRPEIFESDGLHLNAAGYKLWNALIGPKLK